jgi:hypothetical protein
MVDQQTLTRMPPPPRPPTRRAGPSVWAYVAALGIMGLVGFGVWSLFYGQHDSASQARAPVVTAVHIDVRSCATEADGFMVALVALTVDQPYSYVGLTGDYVNANGVAIGQGIGSVGNAVPDRSYRVRVLYGIGGGNGVGGTCEVRVDSAF